MHFLRFSLQASLCLLSLPLSEARAANRLAERLGLIKRQSGICVEDDYYEYISTADGNTVFCSVWNTSPNATTTTYYTPTSTSLNIRTTSTFTQPVYIRITSTVTATATTALLVPKLKRAPLPTPAPLNRRRVAVDQLGLVINRALDGSTIGDTFASSFNSDVSSACSCLALGPLFTDTVTFTDVPVIKVQTAFAVTTYRTEMTSVVRTITTTITQTLTSHTGNATVGDALTSTSLSTVTVSPSPLPSNAPYGYNFTCPGDHNTTQMVVIGREIYSYHVFCNASFSNETSVSTLQVATSGDCLARCSAANSLSHLALCRGFSYDGASCSLYDKALVSDLTSTQGVDSAVLAYVKSSNTTFQNRTAGTGEISSVVASMTSGLTIITPPPEFVRNETATTTCSTSTTTNTANGEVGWTAGCYYSSAWYEAWAISATTIYSSEVIIVGGGSDGSSAGGGGLGSSGQTITQIMATSTAESGSGSESTGTGGGSGPLETTLTTIISGTTIVSVITYVSSGSGSGMNGTGGAGIAMSTGSVASGAGNGSSANGGVLTPYTSTLTTIIGGSTSVYVTTFETSGAGSDSTGTGGVIRTSPSNFTSTFTIPGSAVVSMGSSESSGAMSASAGTGGIFPTGGGNFTITIRNATTVTLFGSGASSGAVSGSTGTGGQLSSIVDATTTTYFSASSGQDSGSFATGGVISSGNKTTTTLINSTISEALLTGATSGATEASSASGGIVLPSSNRTFSATTTNRPRSGSQSPSGTAPGRSGYAPYGNLSSPIDNPSGTAPVTETSPIDTASSGFPAPTSNGTFSHTTTERPRSGSQTPSIPSSGFPFPSPNSTWLGESVAASSTTPAQLGYGYRPPLNHTAQSANASQSRETTERPRSGSQTPSGPSAFPLTSPNITWLGEIHPGPTGTSPTAVTSVSASPVPMMNSTYCSTFTSRETVTETIYTSTPGCVCASTSRYGAFPWNADPQPTFTADEPKSSSTATSSVTSSATPTPTSTSLEGRRQPNQPATPEQVKTSCKTIGNQIFNGEFELIDANSNPLGWGFASDQSDIGTEIMFLAFVDASQHTTGGNREGRIVSNDTTATGTMIQPLTLCPNGTYSLSAWTRQSRVLAQCSAKFSVGGKMLGSVAPGQVWSSGISNKMDYTVGPAEADASVDLKIEVKCVGSGNSSGKRVIDFDDLDLSVVM